MASSRERRSSAGEGTASPPPNSGQGSIPPDDAGQGSDPPAKRERSATPGVVRQGKQLIVDLSNLDRSLLKPSHGKLPLLKQNNYHTWAQAHKRFLTGRGIFGIASGDLPCPSEDREPESTNWMVLDSWILHLLASNVEDTQQTHISDLETSKGVWNELRRVHGVSGKGRLAPMLQRLHGYVKGADESIDKMASTLKQLCDEIQNLAPEARPADISIACVIMNACQGEEYKMTKHTLNQAEDLTSALAVEQLRAVEQDVQTRELANAASSKGNRSGRQGQSGQSSSTDRKKARCFCCGKKGHWKYECPDNPDKEGENEDEKGTQRSKNERKSSSKSQSRPKTKEKANHAADDSGSDDDSPGPSQKERVWMSVHRRHRTNKAKGWLIDSGATRHMTPQRELFTNMSRYNGVVEFGNRGELPVEGKGDIQVRIGRHVQTLKDVLYVPGIGVNLLSIMALDRRGFLVNFGDQNVKIIDKRTAVTVALGQAVNGLYELTDCTSHRALVSQVKEHAFPAEEEPRKAFELMHQRLGHPGAYRLKNLHLNAEGVEAFAAPDDFQCDTCDAAKMVATINREPRTKTTVPGMRLHSDVWGKFPVGSIIDGCSHFASLIDEATGRAKNRPIKSRSEVTGFLVHSVKVFQTEDQKVVVVIRTDNAKEYEVAEKALRELGVVVEFTSTYTAYQNGISERYNRTIITIARALLLQSGLPLTFWAEAVRYANHLYNKLPEGTRGSKSPDELWTQKKPDLSVERVFGCVCRVLMDEKQRKYEKRTKLDAVSYLGIYTGYHSTTQYRVYRPDKNRFYWPANVKFYEHRKGVELIPQDLLPKFNWMRADTSDMEPVDDEASSGATEVADGYISSDDDDQGDHGRPAADTTSSPTNDQNTDFGRTDPSVDRSQGGSQGATTQTGENPPIALPGQQDQGDSPPAIVGHSNSQGTLTNISDERRVTDSSNDRNETPPATTSPPTPAPASHTSTRRSAEPTATSSRPSRTRKPATRTEFLENFGSSKSKDRAYVTHQKVEPRTYEEAINGPDAREWKLAIAKQLEALLSNGTWQVASLPPGRKPVTCKWVFKIKYNSDGTIDKYKARLVARGFTQVEDIDFHETFAPTLRFESLRMLIAFAMMYGLLIHQLDVDDAYLNSVLDEEIYMVLPLGYPSTNTKGKALRLLKGLYGLKQSARIWNQKFGHAVTEMGFRPISSDKCIYLRVVGQGLAIIALYVDDILVLTKTESLMKEIKGGIKKAFKVKDSGEVKRILGIQVHRDSNRIVIEQSQYARKLLQDYGMEQCTPVGTPLDGYESITAARPDEEQADQRAYQQRIGSLMYLMTGTRPDLAFAIGKLSQYCHAPTVRHANAVNRVLRYVAGTTDLGLCYRRDGAPVAYSDSAYGDDKLDRKSTYGHVLMSGQAACIWSSKKQRGVATSTTEAEYVALTEAAKTIVWTTRWLQELHFRTPDEDPIRLLGDNKASLALAKNPEYHQRTKHIDIQYHYIREVLEDGAIRLDYVPTAEQAADIFTKPLTNQAFQRCKELLGLYSLTGDSK